MKSIPERLAERFLRSHKGKYAFFVYLLLYILLSSCSLAFYIWLRMGNGMGGIGKYEPWFLAIGCLFMLRALNEIEIVGFIRIIRGKERGKERKRGTESL